MGQQEIIQLLEKRNSWITAKEITEKLNVNGRIVRRALMVLVRFNEVLRKRLKNNYRFEYIYKLK